MLGITVRETDDDGKEVDEEESVEESCVTVAELNFVHEEINLAAR